MVFGKQQDITSRERCSQAALQELGPASTGAHRPPERHSGVTSVAPGEAHTSLRLLASPDGHGSVSPPSPTENAGRREKRAHLAAPMPSPAPAPPSRPGPPLTRHRADRARRAPAAPPRPCGSSAAPPAPCGRCYCSPAAPVSSARGGTGRAGPGRAGPSRAGGRRGWPCALRSRSAWRLPPQLRWAHPGLVPPLVAGAGPGLRPGCPRAPRGAAAGRAGPAVTGALLPSGCRGGPAGVSGSCDRNGTGRSRKRSGCLLSRNNNDRRCPEEPLGWGSAGSPQGCAGAAPPPGAGASREGPAGAAPAGPGRAGKG